MHTETIEQTIDGVNDTVRPQIERAKQQARRIGGRVVSVIQDHPAACLLGALALGFVVARVARRRS